MRIASWEPPRCDLTLRRLDGEIVFDDDGEVVLTVPDCVKATGANAVAGEKRDGVAADGGGERE